MEINHTLLQKLAELSMLEIENSEHDKLKAHLEEVLDFVENLNTMDLKEVGNLEQENTPFREDCAVHSPSVSQAILKQAPQSQEGYFDVPKIIET
ncbi:Asp-tRNA(Asn)/Glu-tRNA(Gln) amidotransferase subunit GatC [Helicobacter suis]|uniref:Asp-tRNA(Asn)/Glu-tRNA(Gln) amidotransferase subunit GatC n=1 Tax=Helicobacter suis TaxID=104628 RepID=UPI0013D6DC46|nr:Asp-tRNA(Asn)/Glu-tRNA(Gln) amidotransferase subunit GatC [Helicobacter suis]